MTHTQKHRNNWHTVGYGFFIAVGSIALLFLLWNTRTLWRGPHITVTSPIAGAEIKNMPFVVSGSTDGVETLRINGRIITLDPSGMFNTREIVPDGYSEIVISGTDSRERTTTVVVPVYHPPTTQPAPEPELVLPTQTTPEASVSSTNTLP